ncbi:MAG: nucleoside hydrolase [Bacteroidales bacterium]|nr:nucleoside hydrolase [Bacteroidales bacterium]
MLRKLFITALLPAALLMPSCGGDSQKTQPNAVILDEDLGSSTDDLFSMMMLYDAHQKGLINFKALMINREGLEYLQLADIINTYYGFADLPIGKTHDAPKNSPVFIPYWHLAKPEEYKEMPTYKRTYTDQELQQLPDAEILYRQILANEPDTSVVIFSIGFPTNIAHLLETKADKYSDLDGIALVKKKVKAMYIMGGEINLDTPEPEYNLKQDPENALTMINKWPSKMYFSPGSTGHKIDYAPENVIADQTKMKLEDSPVCMTYKLFDCNTGQRMWDACAIQQYLHPEFYKIHGPVKYTVDEDMVLHEQPGTLHFMTYTETAAQDTIILNHIRETSNGGLRK